MNEEIFQGFSKIARLSRECIITEKIDGTNGQIAFSEDLHLYVGSRNRWLTPDEDNYGFCKWALEHEEELRQLGPGRHFGEWWGKGIQRDYNQTQRFFSLFNTIRWCESGLLPALIPNKNPKAEPKYQQILPTCCRLVPVLYRGIFSTETCQLVLDNLFHEGSRAAPGFNNPEGIVVYHAAGNVAFKKTIMDDNSPKSEL